MYLHKLSSILLACTLAAPAFADDASGFIETPAVTSYAPNQPREFTARHAAAADQSLISREAVSSSAFSSSN